MNTKDLDVLLNTISTDAETLHTLLVEAINSGDVKTMAALCDAGKAMARQIGYAADTALNLVNDRPTTCNAEHWFLPPALVINRESNVHASTEVVE